MKYTATACQRNSLMQASLHRFSIYKYIYIHIYMVESSNLYIYIYMYICFCHIAGPQISVSMNHICLIQSGWLQLVKLVIYAS